MFKILHTSDWHLGKKLFKADRLEEHEYFLNWLSEYIQEEQVNLLLVAGDIFDSPNPSNQSLKLFYDFIFKLGKIDGLQTVIIPGNHDSTSLFEVPKDFFALHNCYIYPRLEKDLAKLEHYIKHDGHNIGIKLLPYFRNYELLNHLNTDAEHAEIESFFKNFFSEWQGGEPDTKILMSHHSFGNYTASGSEHAIFLSGLDRFPLEWVRDTFDYVALGHIHKKQTLNQDPVIIYPGSPIPLRFSEHNQKYVSLLTETDNKKLVQKDIRIPLKKHLIQLNTTQEHYEQDINGVLAKSVEDDKDFLLEVIIEMDSPKAGIADHIRELITDSKIVLVSFIPKLLGQSEKNVDYGQINQLDLNELFERYYAYKFDVEEVPKTVLDSFHELLSEVNGEDT